MAADRFLSTLSLVSRFPIKARFSFDPSRIDFYLPLTGIFPAISSALVFVICRFSTLIEKDGGRILTVLLILIPQYLLFNLFHLDGLMDSADALLVNADAEKRHAILKDSRIGVYGFFAGAACLGLKTALLYTLLPGIPIRPAVIFVYPIAGRFAAALIPCLSVPAKPGGLGALVKDSRLYRCITGCFAGIFIWASLLYAVLLCAACFRLLSPEFPGALAIIATVFLPFAAGFPSAAYFALIYRKKIGGYTGDALGAAVECGELLHLAAIVLLF